MNNDYRLSQYSTVTFDNISVNKENFLIEFKKLHPRAKKIYTYVNRRKSPENILFRDIYYNTCIYCGVNTQINSSSQFEVDHVIAQANNDSSDKHDINNLANSCCLCNGRKKAIDITKYMDLHPDVNKLNYMFYRDNDFYIKIDLKYQNIPEVTEFYNILKLNDELHRLEYLLITMKGFCIKNSCHPKINEIKDFISNLEQYRREQY